MVCQHAAKGLNSRPAAGATDSVGAVDCGVFFIAVITAECVATGHAGGALSARAGAALCEFAFGFGGFHALDLNDLLTGESHAGFQQKLRLNSGQLEPTREFFLDAPKVKFDFANQVGAGFH